VNRRELIQRLVLNAICDDYENVDQVILRDIVGALAELIKGGLAKAYFLSSTGQAKGLESMPSVEVVEVNFQTYFYITKQGLDFHRREDKWWPFDDEGKPLA
jgi:hypothetical protein